MATAFDKRREEEAYIYLRETFPDISHKDINNMLGVWKEEGNLETAAPESFPIYSRNNPNLRKFKSGTREMYQNYVNQTRAENAEIQRYNANVPQEQRRALKPVLSHGDFIVDWNSKLQQEFKDKYQPKNNRLSNLTPEQKEEFTKRFYDVTYSHLGGADYKGIGPFQVTGVENVKNSLKAIGRDDLVAELDRDPTYIREITKNPDLVRELSMGYIKNRSMDAEGKKIKGGLEGLMRSINPGEGAERKQDKRESAAEFQQKFKEPVVSPKYRVEGVNTYQKMVSPDELARASLGGWNDTNIPQQTTAPVNINTEPTGLENPLTADPLGSFISRLGL